MNEMSLFGKHRCKHHNLAQPSFNGHSIDYLLFGCEDAAQQVLMSVLVNQSQAIQSNANEFRLCAFLDLVSKSKLEGYIVMEGTFRLCAFLFCVSKSKP